jgi:Leucine-rich repeat (LRR) protein
MSLLFAMKNYTQAEHFYLNHNKFEGTIPSEVFLLSNLQFCDISYNFISGTIPSEIGISSHRDLVLSSNRLEGTIPDEVYKNGLDQLQDLKLDHCNLTGTLSTRIGKLSGLQNLHLQNNAFLGRLPSELGQLQSLMSIRLNGNDFTGSIPDEMCQLQGPNTLTTAVADCAPQEETGAPAQIDCNMDTCCTSCCEADTGICVSV